MNTRFAAARKAACDLGAQTLFDAMVSKVGISSHVVVAMPLLFARGFLTDSRILYQGYDQLVGSGSRTPAPFENDSERRVVGGLLFGSFASEIRYGVLSLDGKSLVNYGVVFVRLKDVAIRERTSFLYENSYILLNDLKVAIFGTLPHGYRSDWDDRGRLAGVKLGGGLRENDVDGTLSHLLQQGKDRQSDRCVEAHVYGTFNANAVESISFAHKGKTREEKNDIRVLREWQEKRATGRTT